MSPSPDDAAPQDAAPDDTAPDPASGTSAGEHPLVGVVGGVGPLATVSFLDAVVRLTEAERDQDHVDLVVLQHATIPDRTAHILGASAEDPGPVMAEDARRLERWGAGFVVVPCNTAHHYTAQIAAAVDVPVVSIVGETTAAAVARRPGLRAAAVLATEGTVAAGVYQRALEAAGVRALVPDAAGQAVVTSAIYDGVKAGAAVDLPALLAVAEGLLAQGAEVVLLGCTELSVVAEGAGLLDDPRFVDSLDALARSTITRAGHRLRERRAPDPAAAGR
ncbi:aspartate/glutamate racemase family protein [uncultured Pseudokineococcus sp.]|uniref:aspartate/glutamate racemase family protein n=1 Tax=uncultured Pseudokineococcus sp. TaxID=1642928 RepID=UPI002627AC21|nr:amino acid racemase [uncultured Pseudokineococcus sp.]